MCGLGQTQDAPTLTARTRSAGKTEIQSHASKNFPYTLQPNMTT